jgi:hypothetical protein
MYALCQKQAFRFHRIHAGKPRQQQEAQIVKSAIVSLQIAASIEADFQV